MAEPRVLVLRAAGINCENETQFGFETAGATVEQIHVNRILEKPDLLTRFGLLALPGGFSYGDHIAGGKVLAVELERALGDHLQAFVDRGGLLLGICNGFQVLVKTGLLPGQDSASTAATLCWNDSHRYEDRWVHLSIDPERCVMAPKDQQTLSLPVGHGEGRFTMDTPENSQALVDDHRAVFRYRRRDGEEPGYPDNPNGSEAHVAGVCDPTGQILGLMPHPDRALFPWSHPAWTRDDKREEGDGMLLFRAAVSALR